MLTLIFIITIWLLSLQIKALTKQEIYYFEDLDEIVQARLKFYNQKKQYLQKRIQKTKSIQIKERLCRKLSKIEKQIEKIEKQIEKIIVNLILEDESYLCVKLRFSGFKSEYMRKHNIQALEQSEPEEEINESFCR